MPAILSYDGETWHEIRKHLPPDANKLYDEITDAVSQWDRRLTIVVSDDEAEMILGIVSSLGILQDV